MRMNAFLPTLAAFLLAACASPNPRATLDKSIAAFDKQDYSESLTLALDAQQHATTAKDANESAYMAGMSAFRLGDYATAERWLGEATTSSDAFVAGESGVMLGNTKLQLKKPAEAGRAFANAAQRMTGDESKKAHIAAANAYREAGDQRSADEQFRLANVPTTVIVDAPAPKNPAPTAKPAGAPPAAAAATTANGPFVIQAGAFRDETKARSRADDLRAKATKAGLGAPRIVTKRGADGATLWVVQIGGFADRRTADAALAKLGASGAVVGRAV